MANKILYVDIAPLGLITLHKDRPIRETWWVANVLVTSNPACLLFHLLVLQYNYNQQLLHQET